MIINSNSISMKKSLVVVLAILFLAGGMALWLVSSHNSFISLNEEVETMWSQVENQYQRRYELIPNLVATVEALAQQEQAVFLGVSETRANAGNTNIDLANSEEFIDFQNAQSEFSAAISRLLVTVEAYPELKSNENFVAFQSQLEGTENCIANARRDYNEAVKDYNTKAKSFPGMYLVEWFDLNKEKLLFEAIEGAEVAPKVEINI